MIYYPQMAVSLAAMGSTLFAAWRFGGGPERVVATVLVLQIPYLGLVYLLMGAQSFRNVSFPHLLWEVGTMAAYLVVALRANRFWPIGFAALRLVELTASVPLALHVPGVAMAAWVMNSMPAKTGVGVLVVGIWAHHQRVKRIGRYPDWRPSLN